MSVFSSSICTNSRIPVRLGYHYAKHRILYLITLMQLTYQVVGSVFAAAVALTTTTYLLRGERSPEQRSLVVFNLAVAVWTAGNALQVATTTLGAKLFWVNVQYLGIALVPLSVFAFGLSLAGASERLSPRKWLLLTAPLALLVAMSWTNGFHGLVRSSETLGVVDGVVVLERTFGPVFWLGWVYSNLLTLAGTALVLRSVVYADRVLERRVLALLVGPLVPWMAHLLYLTGAIRFESEVFFAFTGVAFAYAVVTWDEIEPAQARDAVLALLDEGVVVIASDGRVADLNGAARELLGLDNAPAVGEPVVDVFSGHPTLIEAYREGAETADIEVEVDGSQRFLEVQLSAFENPVGDPDHIIVLRDVSEIRTQAHDLERQNERLESFASILSHDLRNPLSVARGRTQLAREDGDVEQLEAVERAHARMETLIENVLTLAREGQSVESFEPVSVRESAESAWGIVETDGARLTVETDIAVRGDPSRLQQFFENLFRNAIEHNESAVTVTVGATADGFYVADDGVGIPESEREQVLESGYTTGADGTGLGLNIAAEIVEAHGWSIAVGAVADGGARFDVTGVERVQVETGCQLSQ